MNRKQRFLGETLTIDNIGTRKIFVLIQMLIHNRESMFNLKTMLL